MKVTLGTVKDRIFYLDGLRVLAVVAVVLIHVLAANVIAYSELFWVQWWFANVLSACVRWAVPVFLMVSGAVLLSKKYHDFGENEWISFFKKRAIRLGIPLLVWTLVYWLLLVAVGDVELSLEWIGKTVLFDQPFEHLYYLWVALFLTFLVPIFVKVKNSANPSILFLLSLSLLFLGVVLPQNRFLGTFWLQFVGYFLLGYYLHSQQAFLKRILTSFWIFAFAEAVLLTSVLTQLTHQGRYIFNDSVLFWHDELSPLTMVSAVCVFVLAQKLVSPKQTRTTPISKPNALYSKKTIINLAEFSFGIYLVHLLILKIVTYVIPDLSLFAKLFLLFPVTLFISSFLTAKAKHIPYLKKAFGFA